MANKRKIDRRDFTYYMQVKDEATKEIVGYISDISTGGFKLDCDKKIPNGQDFRLQIELTADVADKTPGRNDPNDVLPGGGMAG